LRSCQGTHRGIGSVESPPVDRFSPGLQFRGQFIAEAIAMQARKCHLTEVFGLVVGRRVRARLFVRTNLWSGSVMVLVSRFKLTVLQTNYSVVSIGQSQLTQAARTY